MPIKLKIINRDGSKPASGLQKPDKNELQKVWDQVSVLLPIRSEMIEYGDVYKKFRLNGKTYKIEIKQVKK